MFLVGERVNTGGRRVPPDYKRCYKDPELYWRFAMSGALGGFWWREGGKRLEESCWRKLRSIIGEIEVKSFNMLVPSPLVGSWSIVEANRAADCLVSACPRPSLLISAGTRVAKAIWKAGYEGEYPDQLGVVSRIDEGLWLTRVPHPSPRNNALWANETVITRAREQFHAWLQTCKAGRPEASLLRNDNGAEEQN